MRSLMERALAPGRHDNDYKRIRVPCDDYFDGAILALQAPDLPVNDREAWTAVYRAFNEAAAVAKEQLDWLGGRLCCIERIMGTRKSTLDLYVSECSEGAIG